MWPFASAHRDASSLIARKLVRDAHTDLCRSDYSEQHGEPRTPQELLRTTRCLLFRDPQTGRPFPWEFHRGSKVRGYHRCGGRLIIDDPSTAIAACVAGQGVFQSLEVGLGPWLSERQACTRILPEFGVTSVIRYTRTIASRHLPPAKIRAFLDFVQEVAMQDTCRPSSNGGRGRSSQTK